MKSSALDMYTKQYADRLPLDAKRVLATLFDDVAQLAYDAWNAADEELASKPIQSPAKDTAFDEFMSAARGIVAYWERIPARACELLRRAVPALGVLSDKDLVVVSRVGREAMIARKNGLDPTDTVALLRGTYAAGVDALAWSFLYYKFAKIPPTTPLGEMLSADELELTVPIRQPPSACYRAMRWSRPVAMRVKGQPSFSTSSRWNRRYRSGGICAAPSQPSRT